MDPAGQLGSVSTEGGPLLVADLSVALTWRGTDGDGRDYQRACDLLERDPFARGTFIEVAGREALLWDMPTGTADVWRRGDGALVLNRTWVDNRDSELNFPLRLPPVNLRLLGQLVVRTGWLAVLWAAESGRDIERISPRDGLALNLSVGNAGLLAVLPNGVYNCLHDEIEDGIAKAMRCWMVTESQP
jgi:hypothetical protein